MAIVQDLLIHEPDCRLITLVGPAGSGKTRLAWQVAMRVRDAFADGVCLIRLAATPSAELLPAAFVDALGLPVPAQGTLEACLLEGVRARDMLLLLDGFEHLLEGAALIEDLLLCAPQVKLLITSRVRLNLHAEWVRQMNRVGPSFAKETGRMADVALLQRTPAWGGAFEQAGDGRTHDGAMSCQRTDRETHAQVSQMASAAGW